uniref:hypothetical protein n=1 Tax=Faecalibaculum rodentium TaxID=1702221 RepID=UPI00272C39E0
HSGQNSQISIIHSTFFHLQISPVEFSVTQAGVQTTRLYVSGPNPLKLLGLCGCLTHKQPYFGPPSPAVRRSLTRTIKEPMYLWDTIVHNSESFTSALLIQYIESVTGEAKL